MFLTPNEVVALTGRKRWRAQARTLEGMGLRYTLSAAGRPVVLQAEVERLLLGGRTAPRRAEPHLDLVT